MQRIKDAWQQLLNAMERYVPLEELHLRDGASESDIQSFEAEIEQRLPEDIRESLLLHDGQEDAFHGIGLIFGKRMMPLAEIRGDWISWRKTEAENDMDGYDGCLSFPSQAIRPAYTLPGWIPLLDTISGNYIGADLSPGPAGHRGQIINFGCDDCHKKAVAARSWVQLLEMSAVEYNKGKLDEVNGYHSDHGDMSLTNLMIWLHENGRFNGERVVFGTGDMPNV